MILIASRDSFEVVGGTRMKGKSESEIAQSYPILSDPMGYSLPGSSIHRIFQTRVLEWGAIAFSAYLMGNSFISLTHTDYIQFLLHFLLKIPLIFKVP